MKMPLPSAMVNKGLQELQPLVASLCREAGAPGLAIGVIHNDRIIHEAFYGRRDVEADLPVDRDTIFFVASLTKGMTATALGILVDQGQLQWTTPVHEILPEMSKTTELYTAKLTVLDILSHRTGKAWADALYLQSNNRVLLPKEQAIPTFDYLPQVEPVRSKYMYNNHAYNIAGLIIEKLSGMSWEDFVTRHIFKPMGMDRTFTSHPSGDENVAAPYNILTDRTPHRLPFCNSSNHTMMFAGQSVRTSLADLLKYSSAYLRALKPIIPPGANDRDVKSPNNTPNNLSRFATGLGLSKIFGAQESPASADVQAPSHDDKTISEIAMLVRPQVARDVDTVLEQTYALGWNRTQLPGSLDFGWNQSCLHFFPVLGESYPGKIAIWHGGNMPGTTAALCLLPESGTAVVVLQNSLGLCDVADWTCQLTLDTLFAGGPAQDYSSLVSQCVTASTGRMREVEDQLCREKIEGTIPRPLHQYTGRYFNAIKNWFIDIGISSDGDELYLEFLGRSDEHYALRHYHHDLFVWNLSYDETVMRAQYVRAAPYYKLEFESAGSDANAAITRLLWRHDKSVPEGEYFCRTE